MQKLDITTYHHLTDHAVEALQSSTGIVIPVYLQPGKNAHEEAKLLEDTVRAFARQIENSQHICLAVDGAEFGAEQARAIADRTNVRFAVSAQNRGKLNAIRVGVQALWQDSLEYFAVVDQDGDHFANELLNFIRAAEHVSQNKKRPNVLVLGRRISRHRPMGFLRGELEELADRLLLKALEYHAVVSGRPLRLEFATLFDEFPDFHSGYKLFSRNATDAAFRRDPVLSGVTEDCYYRHGCEAVMSVEPLLDGAQLVVVNRSTFNQQPFSSFARLNRPQLVADKIIWPCKRLNIPSHFVDQWLRNYIPPLLLTTLTPDGEKELGQIRGLVLRAVCDQDESHNFLGNPLQRPLFL